MFSVKINSKTFYSTKSKQIHGLKTILIQYLEYVLNNIHRKEIDDLLRYSHSIIRTFKNP
ncbi:MAG: hypothetical protein WC888_04295 [Candidatus Izemoplasmatales bacterium]